MEVSVHPPILNLSDEKSMCGMRKKFAVHIPQDEKERGFPPHGGKPRKEYV